MKRISNYLTVAGLIAAAILTAYGKPFVGVSAAVVALLVKLWQHHSKQVATRKHERDTHTVARMMLNAGMGNFYTESVFVDIELQGRAKNTPERFAKAVELDPNDEFGLLGVATGHALEISGRKGHGEAVNLNRLKIARRICRRGRKLYPKNAGFIEALGILADSEGHHEIAQHWFRKAGSLAEDRDFSWRTSLATSLAMTGDHEEELRQLEEAKKTAEQFGVGDLWILDFYMGRALCSIGRYNDALPCLRQAARKRGIHPDISRCFHIAHVSQCHLFRAAFHEVACNVALVTSQPNNALRMLPRTAMFTGAVCWNKVKRAVFFALATVVSNRPLLYRLLHPDDVHTTLSCDLCSANQFKAAEDLCRKGLGALPDSVELLSNLSMALAFQGRREDAIAEIDKGLLLARDDRVLKWNRHNLLTQEEIRVRPIRSGAEVPDVSD